MKRLYVLFIIACAAVASAAQQNAAEIGPRIDKLFAGYNASTPGVAVAVVIDGKVAFKKGYGSANLEFTSPISSKTIFNIASVSKQFTAFSIYLLEKQGKLSLEDDIRKFLPELPEYKSTVRIKHILGHTSGIRDQGSILTLAGWERGDTTTNEHVLRFVSRQKELNFEPGSRYLYSNTGYTLAAEIVHRVSGKTFAEFARENIFAPLQMNDSYINDDFAKPIRDRADSYELENGTYKRVAFNDSTSGQSNLNTTVEDLAKWAINLEQPRVGDAELIRRFNEPTELNNGEPAVYFRTPTEVGYHAKGQVVRKTRGVNIRSHGGHAAGYRSTFWRFPDQRFAVVLLSNDEHFEQLKNAEAIIEMGIGHLMEPKPAEPLASPASTPARPIYSNALNDYAGRFYNDEIEAFYTATVIAGKLTFNHVRLGRIELTETGTDKFSGRIGFPVEIEFVRNPAREVIGFRVSNFGAKNVRFERVRDVVTRKE